MTLTTHYITILMSIPRHNNDLATLAGISLSPSSNTKLSPLLVMVDPIVFVYSFTIEGHNVIITIDFFPHVLVLEDFFSLEPMDDDFGDVDTLLNL